MIPPTIRASVPKSSQTSIVNEPARDLGVSICGSAFCSGMNLPVLSAAPVGGEPNAFCYLREHFLVNISLTLRKCEAPIEWAARTHHPSKLSAVGREASHFWGND